MTPSAWTTRMVDAPSDDLMDAHTLSKLLGVSVDTIEQLVKDGDLPMPLKIGKRSKVWEWRAVAYYRLRMELFPRIAPLESALEGKPG